LALTVSTDVLFALLLGVPMTFLALVEAARSFSELVHRHHLHQERAQRRAFLAERKPYSELIQRS